MNQTVADPLLQAVTQLRELFPEWRFGQLVANLTTAVGRQEPEAIWDVEDQELLAAAERLIARNQHRRSHEDSGSGPVPQPGGPVGGRS
jgi:hypothetical protein